MNVQATCGTCGRLFLLSQIGPESDAPGRCPFCGARFAGSYSSLLLDAVRATESSAGDLSRAIGRLQNMDAGFEIDVDDLLRSLADALRERSPGARTG